MTPSSADKMPTDATLPDNLPVLTHIVGEPLLDDLPTLTEIVTPEAPSHPAYRFSEEEIQQLLKQLDSRLEVMFTQKLNLHLEKLQRLAIKQAVHEFRATLPELLRDILNTPPAPRP